MYIVKDKQNGRILAGVLETIECEKEANKIGKNFVKKGFAKEYDINEIFDLDGE